MKLLVRPAALAGLVALALLAATAVAPAPAAAQVVSQQVLTDQAEQLLADYENLLDWVIAVGDNPEPSVRDAINAEYDALEAERAQLHADRAQLPSNCDCAYLDSVLAAIDNLSQDIYDRRQEWTEWD